MIDISANKLDNFVTESRGLFERYLKELVEIPTVSTDPNHKEEIQKGASLAASFLSEAGARVEVIQTSGNPVILGHIEVDAKAPTIAIYHHLDVQPASPAKWRYSPFKFTATPDGHYLGRGTTDDKGPALVALLAARFVRQERIPINITFIWEMEEEIGSPNFEEAIKTRNKKIRPDSILVSDSVWISRDKPAITYGLRGLMGVTLTLTTAERDAHSGLVGGAARNPIAELCQLITQCFDPMTGRVKIEGFYDKVRKPSPEEMEEFKNSGFKVSEFKEANGLKMIRTEDAGQIIQATWCEPTFEVHGLAGGYTGNGVMTIVPHKAEAKVSARLVADQSPNEIFQLLKNFVAKKNPEVVVELEGVLEPYLGEFSGPHAQAARDAVGLGFGLKPVFVRCGGSIGSVVSMQNLWHVPIVLLGLSLPEHGYHAPNEYFDWEQACGGIKTLVHYLQRISQIDKKC